MKKAEKRPIVQLSFNFSIKNNKVVIAGEKFSSIATNINLLILICVATLVVSRCCPDLLSDFIRWILITATGI